MTDTESRDPSQIDPDYEERLKAFRKAAEEAALELQTNTGFRLPLSLPPEIRSRYEERLAACRRVWGVTGDPLAVAEAVTWTHHYRQPIEPWIEEAVVQALVQVRSKEQANEHCTAARELERYFHIKDATAGGMTWEDAKQSAAGALNCSEVTALKSYCDVKRQLDDHEDSRFHYWTLKDIRYRELGVSQTPKRRNRRRRAPFAGQS